jgi:ATP-dependent exoDNAse (exonuclease V) beta subunit
VSQQLLLLNLSMRHGAAARSARAAFVSGESSFMAEGNSAVLWRSLAEVDLRSPRSTRTETVRERPRIFAADELPAETRKQAAKPVTLAVSQLHSNEKPTEVVEDETEESYSPLKVAAARGTLIHKAFELWDSSRPAESEAQRLTRLLQLAEPAGADKALGEARAEALEFVRGFSSKLLFQRLQAVSACIRAREFPVLMPGGEDASGALIGTIDMVYEEPEGSVVIVDYKSDKCDEATLIERHRSQLAKYVEALGAVLAPKPVRAELWSIHNDCVVTLA